MPAPPPGQLNAMLNSPDQFRQVMGPAIAQANPATPRPKEALPGEFSGMLASYRQGKLPAGDIVKFFKDRGWRAESSGYGFELRDPSGGVHSVDAR